MLTIQERRAIEMMTVGNSVDGMPASRTCKRYGFKSVNEFLSNQESAKAKLIDFFGSKGIRSVDDIPFPTIGHSVEHTMMTKAQMVRKAS